MKLPTSDNARGALFMAISMAGFSINDALIKLMSMQLGMWQAVFLRGMFASALIALLWWRSSDRLSPLSWRETRLIGLRLIGEIGGTVCFLTAIVHLPLANATAILQAMPLAVTLAAAMFLGEKVGWRRYVAIVIGFAGVLIILRPGGESFNHYSLWAVASCGFLVLRDLSTRRLPATIPSRFVAMVTAITITLVGGLATATQPWVTVEPAEYAILALTAVFVLTGYLFGTMAMRQGDIGAVSPFRYSILLWATLLGALIFNEWPDGPTLIGSALLVATGVYSIRRELTVRRQAAMPATAAIPASTSPIGSDAPPHAPVSSRD